MSIKVDVHQVVRKRLPDQVCLEEATNVVNDSADVTSSGRSFHVCGSVTGKARLPTVDSLLIGTTSQAIVADRTQRSATR